MLNRNGAVWSRTGDMCSRTWDVFEVEQGMCVKKNGECVKYEGCVDYNWYLYGWSKTWESQVGNPKLGCVE